MKRERSSYYVRDPNEVVGGMISYSCGDEQRIESNHNQQGSPVRVVTDKVLVGTDADIFFRSSAGYGRGKYRSRTRRVGNMTREDLAGKN